MNSRIDHLTHELNNAIPIPARSTDGRIGIGSAVTVSVNGKEMKLEILGTQESNPSKGRISYVSPIGAALLGHVAGDTVTVDIGDRTVEYSVLFVD